MDKLAAAFTLGLIFVMALASGILIVSTIFHLVDAVLRAMLG